MNTNQLRVRALRRLMGGLSQAEFADRYNLNASYLSQILNGLRSFGEKAAVNMEEKIGVSSGTLSRPDLEPNYAPEISDSQASYEISAAKELHELVTPRSKAVLDRIILASAEGRLSDADIELLDQIAARFEGNKSPKAKGGANNKLRDRLKKDDTDARQ